jgi:hypothetical protein
VPAFVDANILVYAEDRDAGSKHIIARDRPGLRDPFQVALVQQVQGERAMAKGGLARRFSLELGPGQVLLGERLVKVPEECARGITVEGLFEAMSAEGWDDPTRGVRIRSQPFQVGQR